MTPSIDGVTRKFAEHGLYDGLFLMRDEETGTFWDHLTGDAVYGPDVGKTLEISNLLHSRVDQVLANYPEALITLSDQAIRTDRDMEPRSLLARVRGGLSRMFSSTVEKEDDRLGTMDIGLGLWRGGEGRYYAYDQIAEEGRAILDTFQGQQTLVFLDPETFVLSAFNVDTESLRWDESVLRLSNGQYIERSILYDADATRAEAARPLQIFTRWYGFALTFPDAEIYGEGRY
jgi:hypothetical protein